MATCVAVEPQKPEAFEEKTPSDPITLREAFEERRNALREAKRTMDFSGSTSASANARQKFYRRVEEFEAFDSEIGDDESCIPDDDCDCRRCIESRRVERTMQRLFRQARNEFFLALTIDAVEYSASAIGTLRFAYQEGSRMRIRQHRRHGRCRSVRRTRSVRGGCSPGGSGGEDPHPEPPPLVGGYVAWGVA